MKHLVERLLEGLSIWQRTYVIGRLMLRLISYRLGRLSRRARIHWIGGPRPKRLERALMFVLLIGAMLVLEFEEFLFWCAAWGGGLSMFVNLYTAYQLIPRRRYHWVR